MTAILVAIAVSQMPDLRAGQHVTVTANADSWIPGAASRDDYAKLILAIRARDRRRIGAMFPNQLRMIPNGSKVEVIEVNRPKTGGNYITDPSPANVPAVVVRMPGKPAAEDPDRFWVPMIYLAAPGARPRAIWDKFPVFKVETYLNTHMASEPGERMVLKGRPNPGVPVAWDMTSFQAMVKARSAGDAVGFRALHEAHRVAMVEDLTPILVIKQHAIIKKHANGLVEIESPATEARILAGPYKDQSCWVQEDFTFRLALRVTGWESPDEKRARTKRRR
jgi:hypothetical protein